MSNLTHLLPYLAPFSSGIDADAEKSALAGSSAVSQYAAPIEVGSTRPLMPDSQRYWNEINFKSFAGFGDISNVSASSLMSTEIAFKMLNPRARHFVDMMVMGSYSGDTGIPKIPHGSMPPRYAQRLASAPAIDVVAEWDGYVDEIGKDYFVGRLRGLKGDGVIGKVEEAEIPISDVDDGDLELLALGAFFRLSIIYERPKVGPKRRYTSVQFRRLPAYSKRELDVTDREANELFDAIQLETGSRSASVG
jgi:hypothetical protein